MRLLKIIVTLFLSIAFSQRVIALTNIEIIELCKADKRKQECIRMQKIRRYNLERGKPIDIPVIPYKK
tara:strand:- start:173 stop:376 length:204 start_codon:yes stop_codon:yes gene_type:complete